MLLLDPEYGIWLLIDVYLEKKCCLHSQCHSSPGCALSPTDLLFSLISQGFSEIWPRTCFLAPKDRGFALWEMPPMIHTFRINKLWYILICTINLIIDSVSFKMNRKIITTKIACFTETFSCLSVGECNSTTEWFDRTLNISHHIVNVLLLL